MPGGPITGRQLFADKCDTGFGHSAGQYFFNSMDKLSLGLSNVHRAVSHVCMKLSSLMVTRKWVGFGKSRALKNRACMR